MLSRIHLSIFESSRNWFVGTARCLAAASMLLLAAPASAGQFVDIFRTVCLETAPKFNGAAELAVEAGATRGPDVFDSHTRYFNDDTPFSVQFRHLAEDTHQCEVVTPLVGKGEETKDFYRLIETFAEQQELELFSRGGFHQLVINGTTHIFSYESRRGAFVLVTLGP
jgi:hypothetical protein